MDTPTSTILINVKDVAEILALGVRTVWRYSSAGRIPAPIKLGRLSRWRAEDIRGWLHATKEPDAVGCWVCWADADELARLRRLYGCPRGNSLHQPYPKELTTQKPPPGSHDKLKCK